MQIGMFLGAGLAADRPTALGDLALHAETLGLDALFTGDHLVSARPFLDSTVVLATVAAATHRIRIGFGVMLPALRPVAWTAKQVTALQQVSGGRVVLGVGSGGPAHGRAGWDAAGVRFEERGRRTDSALELLPQLIAGAPTTLGGTTVTLAPGSSVPPIWVGGASTAALRRCVTHGDAWFPSMAPMGQITAKRTRLAELADEQRRAVPDLAVGALVHVGTDIPAADLARTVAATYGIAPELASNVPITGPPAAVAERFAAWADAGATTLVLPVVGDWQQQAEKIAEARALM